MIPRRTTFEFEYLGEFKMDIKNIFGHESAAHMGLIREEKQRQKISCYCTFNQTTQFNFMHLQAVLWSRSRSWSRYPNVSAPALGQTELVY
jgi:hypothetical protein